METQIEWEFIFPYLKVFDILKENDEIESSSIIIINISYRLIIIYLQNSDTDSERLLSCKYTFSDNISSVENIEFKINLINSFLIYNNYPLLLNQD